MSGINLAQLSRGTAPNTYVVEPSDQEFNILISTGTGSGLVRYSKTVAAAGLGTSPITYVIDSRNPSGSSPSESRDLLMDLSINSARTLLTIALRDLASFPNEMVVSVYALREVAEQGGGGTTVVANPTTDQSDPTLDSITIGSEDYRVIGQQPAPDPLTEQKILDAIPDTPTDGQVLTFDANSGNLIWTSPATGSGSIPQQNIEPTSNYRQMYDALEEAIFAGAHQIVYSGKTVQYKSTDEMIKIHRMLAQKLGIGRKPRVATMTYKQRSYH